MNATVNGAVLYRKVGPGKYLFDAQVKIDTLQNLIPVDIPDGDYETLGGFILYKMGRIPGRSDTFKYGPLLFVIEDAGMKFGPGGAGGAPSRYGAAPIERYNQ